MVYRIFCGVGLLAASAWGQDGAAAAVAELERRLNSGLVDEIVGEVDYDFVYFKKGTHAYALENVQRFQRAGKMRWDARSRTMVIRQEGAADTVESAVLSLGPGGDAKEGPVRLPREEKPLALEEKAVSDSAVAAAALRPAGSGRPERSAHTRPFARDSTRTYGGRAARLRHFGDGRGDISSFDLGGGDAARLQRRAKPERLRHIDGVRLGVSLARPSRRGMAKLTRMEDEHRIGRRRAMRLELRELYAGIPAGVLLDIKILEIKHRRERARAAVEWSYTDAPARKRRATLRLLRVGEEWQIEGAWDFVEALAKERGRHGAVGAAGR